MNNQETNGPMSSALIRGIVERAGKARDALAETLKVPATWPAIIEAVERERNQHANLVEALKGVAIMLNTELAKYEDEPWAQRVRAALKDGD